MSAFVVSRPHIAALVEALYRYEVYPDGLDATALGQLLWEENITSVLARYRDCTRDDMPGPCEEDFVFVWVPNPARSAFVRQPWNVLGLVRCYEYQSCEHDGWLASDACQLLDALQERVLRSVQCHTMEEARNRPEWNKAPWDLYEEPA